MVVAGGLGLAEILRRASGGAAPALASGPAESTAAGRQQFGAQVVPTPIFGPTTAPSGSSAPGSSPGGGWLELGRSVQSNPIRAIRLGDGPVRLALMGGIHGGWERNTERLALAMYEHLSASPGQIPSALTCYFVPGTNPDGLAAGNGPDAAWNARGVDLNRNFDTANWSPDTFGRPGGRYGPSGMRKGAGGAAPFSEPETRVIRDFILGYQIDAVLSYHSGIVSVSAKDGGGGIGEPLARLVAAETGYPYVPVWTEYRLTGQFMDWLDDVGVMGVEVDLPNQQSIDWEQNVRAVMVVMAALASGSGAGARSG